MQRISSEGMNNFLGFKAEPFPQRPCPHIGLEILGTPPNWRALL
jgi:hypothetical protein